MKRAMHNAKFARFDMFDWCVTACGYKNQWNGGRFRLDRQNLTSVWNNRTGLIMGGGHSKFQTEFSLFNVFINDGTVKFLHDEGKVRLYEDGLEIRLLYGDVKVGVNIKALNADTLSITYKCYASNKALSDKVVRHNLIFAPQHGGSLVGGHSETSLADNDVYWTKEDHGGILKHNGWSLTIPDGEMFQTTVSWPVHPFFSYRLDAKSEKSSAAMVLSGTFNTLNKELEYILKIEK